MTRPISLLRDEGDIWRKQRLPGDRSTPGTVSSIGSGSLRPCALVERTEFQATIAPNDQPQSSAQMLGLDQAVVLARQIRRDAAGTDRGLQPRVLPQDQAIVSGFPARPSLTDALAETLSAKYSTGARWAKCRHCFFSGLLHLPQEALRQERIRRLARRERSLHSFRRMSGWRRHGDGACG